MKIALILTVCLAAMLSQQVAAQKIACRVDVVFCVDNSGSIRDSNVNGVDNWSLLENFIVDLIKKFPISSLETRAALVDFGNAGHLEWGFTNYTTEADQVSAVQNLKYRGENTNMTGGLVMSYQLLTGPTARTDVNKVIILITDGKPTYSADQLPAAVSAIKAAGIRLLCVGVTNQINTTLLMSMASSPTDYAAASDFSALSNIVNVIINNQTCQPVTTPTTTTVTTPTTTSPTTPTPTTTTTAKPTLPPVTQTCNTGFDLVLVIDGSSSLGYSGFKAFIEYAVSIISNLDVESGKYRIAAAVTSTNAVKVFDLNTYTTRLDMITALRNCSYPAGSANFAAGFNYVRTQMFTAAAGDRSTASNVCVLIADGNSVNPSVTISEASQVMQQSIRIVSVLASNWYSSYEFQNIVSSPYKMNWLQYNYTSDLNSTQARQDLLDTICSNSNTCANTPCNGGTCTISSGGTPVCNCGSNSVGGTSCQLNCRQVADVIFMSDMSGSYGSTNYQNQVNFMKSMVQGMNVGQGANRVAFITFGTQAILRFHLNQYTTMQQIQDGFNVPYSGGTTDLAGTLALATTEVKTNGLANRPKIVVIFTDGPSDNFANTTTQARLLRLAGATIVVLPVGTYPDMNEVSAVVSNPSAANIINITSYTTYSAAQTPLQAALCSDMNACDSNPCKSGGSCVPQINGYQCKCPAGFTGINCERQCSGKVDIVFVLDASGSIRSERFPYVQEYVNSVIEQLQVSPSDAQIAAVSYSDVAYLQFKLNDYSTKQDAQLAIRRIPFAGGRTNTAAALRMMMDTVFTTANGDRADAPNFCIILTDGNSNINVPDTIPAAIEARQRGIEMIAFGVGTDLNVNEMKNLASEPYANTVLNITTMYDFPRIKDAMVNALCDSGNACASNPCQNGGTCLKSPGMYQCACPKPYSGERCERTCNQQMDVSLVLDTSGSVEEVYNIIIALAKQTVYGLPIYPGASQVSVITYSNNATLNFLLNKYTTNAAVRAALSFSQAEGTTNTQAAITLSYQSVFNTANGARSGVRQVMIVASDGQSNVNQANTIPSAAAAKQRGIEIFSYGIGQQVYKPEMESIATTKDAKHVVYVPTMNDVTAGAKSMLDLLCQS